MESSQRIAEAAALFAQSYAANDRALKEKPRWVGVECEYPVVYADGSPINRDTLAEFWADLGQHGWELISDQPGGKPVAAKRDRESLIGHKTYAHDVITTELGYPVLELALAPEESLVDYEKNLDESLRLVTGILADHDARLIGYGVHPRAMPSTQYLEEKQRYHLINETYMNEQAPFNTEYDLGVTCISASIQAQVEVATREAVQAMNALNVTAGLRVALFANSPVWRGTLSDFKAVRQAFYDWIWQSRSDQIGMAPHLKGLEDYVEGLLGSKSLIIYRKPEYLALDYTQTFRSFMDAPDAAATTVTGDTRRIAASPDDIFAMNAATWFDARLRSVHGTIEERVCCQQPPTEQLASPALTLGLVENIDKFQDVVNAMPRERWRDLTRQRCARGMTVDAADIPVKPLIARMLEIAEAGLTKRGFGEEVYLRPLWDRVNAEACPADLAIEVFRDAGPEGLVAHSDMRQFSMVRGE